MRILLVIALLDRLVRYRAIWRFLGRRPQPAPIEPLPLVSILQPILSGDPTLAASLEANLSAPSAYPREWIWLVDRNDTPGRAIGAALLERYPDAGIRLIMVEPPSCEQNPKLIKLIIGTEIAQGAVIAVLDDDTRLPAFGLDQLVAGLAEPGAGLAFGLPYYVNFNNLWSALTAQFVNSTSLTTYIPMALLAEPSTINGMCYVIDRSVLERVGGFRGLEPIVADDFAVAQRMRIHNVRLVQTRVRHAISTQIAGPGEYWRLMQRWLIFPRESLMRHLGPADTLRFYSVVVLPLLMPWLALSGTMHRQPAVRRLSLAYFAIDWIGTWWINRAYLNSATPARWAWLLPIVQLLLPAQIITAWLAPQQIIWRGHTIRIKPGGTIRIERQRS